MLADHPGLVVERPTISSSSGEKRLTDGAPSPSPGRASPAGPAATRTWLTPSEGADREGGGRVG